MKVKKQAAKATRYVVRNSTGTGDTDGELVRQAQQGDRPAFDNLVSRYRRLIYARCLCILRNGDDAAEATQETFVRAFVNIGSYRYNASVGGWLQRIAGNICFDRLRRAQVRNTANIEAVAEKFLIDPADNPDQNVLSSEQKAVIEQARATLPAGLRAVFQMCYVENLSPDEIADILNIPPATVRSRLNRVHQLLREKLAEYFNQAPQKEKRLSDSGRGPGEYTRENFTKSFSDPPQMVRLLRQGEHPFLTFTWKSCPEDCKTILASVADASQNLSVAELDALITGLNAFRNRCKDEGLLYREEHFMNIPLPDDLRTVFTASLTGANADRHAKKLLEIGFRHFLNGQGAVGSTSNITRREIK